MGQNFDQPPALNLRILDDLAAGEPFYAAADRTSPFTVGPAEELASAALRVQLDTRNKVQPLTSAISEVVNRLSSHAGLAKYSKREVEFRFTVTDTSPYNQVAVHTLGAWVAGRWNLPQDAVSFELSQRDPDEARATVERILGEE